MVNDAIRPGLKQGDEFASLNGQRRGSVGEFLGQGGQGAVFRADFGTGVYAIKWYHNHYIDIDTNLKDRLVRAIARGAPDHRFLWPLELVFRPEQPGSFGYVMGIRPGEFRSIRELLAPPPNRIELSLEKRFFVCWQIADSFLSMHANGFCYQDINFGNFFIHPSTGQVMICDNDNVNVDGGEASVYGTRKFMAPEIVRRETFPNSRTDLYSMAVLFFYVLIGWHPLDGKREAEAQILTPDLEQALYGTDPLFIFDAGNDANGPVSPLHDMLVCRWNTLPASLRSLFQKAFGPGLHNPNERVIEKDWIKAFEACQRAVFTCDVCRFEHVFAPELDTSTEISCAYCSESVAVPATFRFGNKCIALTIDSVIALTDLGNASANRWESAAVIVGHPTKPGVLGMRNTTSDPWRVKSADGTITLVSPGKTVLLADRLLIEIGQHSGRIHAPSGVSSLKNLETEVTNAE
jgi:DNA-binding helix-hairpin-helix protein with protein kinase domain